MLRFCLSFWAFAVFLIMQSTCQNISMRAWVSEGYYYSHRCQVNIEVISNYFESSYQLFHVLAKQNAYFFNTVEYDNVFYIKGTNEMEAIMTSNEVYCKFPMSTTYYCPFISITGYDPYGLKYFEAVNTTHKKLLIRLSRTICPAQGNKMSLRIQMPIASDYPNFYMYTPAITDKAILTVDKLSFVYDQQVEVNLTNLEYKQVKQMSFGIPDRNFITGCQVNYSITLKFENITYYQSLDQISIYITPQTSLQMSTTCSSNITKPYQCLKTSYGFQLTNMNQTNMNKSYEIAEQQYYDNEPVVIKMEWGMGFLGSGKVDVEVVAKGNGNSYVEGYLNMTHDKEEVYGRVIKRVEAFDRDVFVKLTGDKYDPMRCNVPIAINTNPTTTNTTTTTTNTTNNTTTNTTINKTTNTTTTTTNTTITNTTTNNTIIPQTNNNTNYNDYTYDTTTGFEVNQLIFLILLIVAVVATLIYTKRISKHMKLTYMLTLVILAISKVLFLVMKVDESWLQNTSDQLKDSITIKNHANSQYSLQLFILKVTFCLQLILNFFYLLNYIVLLTCSQQLATRIKKFYGTKQRAGANIQSKITTLSQKEPQNQQQAPRNSIKCNLSSVLFTLVTYSMFLLSFKFYGTLIFKLQLNLDPNDQEDFLRYRFKNSVLYKMHAGHLVLDLLLECNAVIWAFLLIKSSQNYAVTVGLYVLVAIYLLQILLQTKVFKVFYLMGNKTDQISNRRKDRLQLTCEEHSQKDKTNQLSQGIQEEEYNDGQQRGQDAQSKIKTENQKKSLSWYIPINKESNIKDQAQS